MSELWRGVDRLIDRATATTTDPARFGVHGIHLLAARRWRALGRPVPDALRQSERAAAIRVLAAERLLARLRESIDGPIVLMKGLEAAARYPDPALRPFEDLDLLVSDPAGTRATLLAAGFVEVPDYAFPHHERPIRQPGLPLQIELHSRPSWLTWMTPPTPAELIAAATPSATGIAGVAALDPLHHALFVAAHSWRHAPLRRLSDLIDVAALAEEREASLLAETAERWGMGRVWAVTRATTAALLGEAEPEEWPLRSWARHLVELRARTVLETHAVTWLGAVWAPPAVDKGPALAATLRRELTPLGGEPWADKARRVGRAVRDAGSAWPGRRRGP